jgi:hypothetical protein
LKKQVTQTKESVAKDLPLGDSSFRICFGFAASDFELRSEAVEST